MRETSLEPNLNTQVEFREGQGWKKVSAEGEAGLELNLERWTGFGSSRFHGQHSPGF